MKGLGQRLRIKSSKTEYFEESVEGAAKALKMLSFNCQDSKKGLLKLKNEDPIELIKKEKVTYPNMTPETPPEEAY